jgi:hypothetical protein
MFGIGALIEVSWFMRPGRTYTLNVGAWVLSEWTEWTTRFRRHRERIGSIVADVMAIALFHHL